MIEFSKWVTDVEARLKAETDYRYLDFKSSTVYAVMIQGIDNFVTIYMDSNIDSASYVKFLDDLPDLVYVLFEQKRLENKYVFSRTK